MPDQIPGYDLGTERSATSPLPVATSRKASPFRGRNAAISSS